MAINVKSKKLGITAAVFVLLIFLHSINILNPIEKGILTFFSPIEEYFYQSSIEIRIFFQRFNYNAGQTELELLKIQNRSLILENARLKLVDEENKLLKKELNFTRSNNFEFVSARIMGYDTLQNSTLLIAQLEDKNIDIQEIKINMPIVIEDGILVGKVTAINQKQIFIEPLTSSHSAVAATILNTDHTMGIVEGELNFGIKMNMIPKTEKIKAGDLIVTSGLEAEMPKGLLIGTVLKVSEDTEKPFKIAHISPLQTCVTYLKF